MHHRLDGEHGTHQRRGGGDPAATFQEVQVVHGEPVADVELVVLHPIPQLAEGQALFLLLGRQIHQQPLPTGGAEGVDDPDGALREVWSQVLCSDHGGLIGGGQCRREAQAQNILSPAQHGPHGVLELAHVGGGSGRGLAGPQALIKLLIGDVAAVQRVGVFLPVHGHGQGQHLQLQLTGHLVGEVAAAVGHDDVILHG